MILYLLLRFTRKTFEIEIICEGGKTVGKFSRLHLQQNEILVSVGGRGGVIGLLLRERNVRSKLKFYTLSQIFHHCSFRGSVLMRNQELMKWKRGRINAERGTE